MTVRAVKAGALEFLTKPFGNELLLETVRSAIARTKKNERSLGEMPQEGITGFHGLKAPAAGKLPRHKLHRVIEYIMENLEGSPTLGQMAGVVHLSSYHFARLFKAATGLAPHQFVITRRIERAQHLLRTNGKLGLAEVAFRSGFANQSHFCLHFKRIAGVTPRRFRERILNGDRSTVDRPRIVDMQQHY